MRCKVHRQPQGRLAQSQACGAMGKRRLRPMPSPSLAALSVQAIDTALVLKVLEPIWTTKPETAGRVRGRIESILDWAKVRGYRAGENPARWRGHLDKLLPARSKVRRVEHHAALPYAELPGFLVSLREQEGIAARALEFAILTAARTGEVIGARWSEMDLLDKTWTLPAGRMKAGREHRVPLSARALAILQEMRRIAGRGRLRVSRWQGRQTPQQHGVLDAVAAHGPWRSDGARISVELPRLGGGAHKVSCRGCRDGAGAHRERQDGRRLQPIRPVRAPQATDGSVGDLLHRARAEGARDVASSIRIRSHRPVRQPEPAAAGARSAG